MQRSLFGLVTLYILKINKMLLNLVRCVLLIPSSLVVRPYIIYNYSVPFIQKYIELAADLQGLSPDVPLYKVIEGHEPSFSTTFFSWDTTKVMVYSTVFTLFSVLKPTVCDFVWLQSYKFVMISNFMLIGHQEMHNCTLRVSSIFHEEDLYDLVLREGYCMWKINFQELCKQHLATSKEQFHVGKIGWYQICCSTLYFVKQCTSIPKIYRINLVLIVQLTLGNIFSQINIYKIFLK